MKYELGFLPYKQIHSCLPFNIIPLIYFVHCCALYFYKPALVQITWQGLQEANSQNIEWVYEAYIHIHVAEGISNGVHYQNSN